MFSKHFYKHFRFFFKKLFDGEIAYYASSLSFYSIFALIPMFLIAIAVAASLPIFDQHIQEIETFLIKNFVPFQTDTVSIYIKDFMKNSLSLGLLGSIAIFIASVLFFFSYEYIVNKIFHTKTRDLWHSTLLYIVMLFSVIITLASSINFIRYMSGFLLGEFKNYPIIALSYMPFFLSWFLLAVMYKFSANTKVNTKAAIFSSFIVAIIWNILKTIFIYYALINKTYETLYGSLSILLFFFMWIYFTWIIIIFGLKMCYIINRTHYYHRSKKRFGLKELFRFYRGDDAN